MIRADQSSSFRASTAQAILAVLLASTTISPIEAIAWPQAFKPYNNRVGGSSQSKHGRAGAIDDLRRSDEWIHILQMPAEPDFRLSCIGRRPSMPQAHPARMATVVDRGNDESDVAGPERGNFDNGGRLGSVRRAGTVGRFVEPEIRGAELIGM